MEREEMSIVVVGHVDHGKSTLIGRLLYDTKSLLDGEVERVLKLSKERGKAFEYAYLLDAFEEEQTQGITIDTTRIRFKTKKRDYIIIDAPGHKEFLKNMISGASNAEAALLLIDGNEGVKEQSKRHGYILSLLGIKKVIVIINKMDLIKYSEEEFNRIKDEYSIFLKEIGVFPIDYVPISAFEGENLIRNSDKMKWNKGHSVVEQIDLLVKEEGLNSKPLRMPIQDVYKFDNRRIISGRIESGTLQVGDKIKIYPSNKETVIKSIEVWPEESKKKLKARALESIGIIVEDEFYFKRGDIIAHSSNSPKESKIVHASIFWMGKEPLIENKEYKLKITTNEVMCEVIEIKKVVNSATLEGGKILEKNSVGEIIIKTKEEISFDLFEKIEATGRFVIVDGFDIVGGGIITGEGIKEVENKKIYNERLKSVAKFLQEMGFVVKFKEDNEKHMSIVIEENFK
ncbi:MAG: sulfate adenylyltransferase subunit 1 [Clostridium sp.]|uniref:sulfate adenylyltransferase subunit 1 n=1 Tax=Clostridium sp. TaxID=1506 RepID=UPI003F401D53